MKRPLSSLGEFGFIKNIKRTVKTGPSVVKGIGDDCAVIKYTKDKYLLYTTDMIIEDVHFLRSAAPRAIGHKALAINISDIAACGGIPRWAVISVGIPPKLDAAYALGIFSGIKKLGDRFGIDIAGGDTNSSDKVIISIALLGEVEKKNLILRSGAKKGDIIFVSGILKDKPDHLTFTPAVAKSRYLVKNFKINSMIDISDGFLSDLDHILEESKKGAMVYESLLPFKNAEKVLNAGEQFELIFTLPRAGLKKLPEGCYPVGEITSSPGRISYVTRQGKRKIIKPRGYRHF